MGIFDSLKNIVANTAGNVISDALNQVKDEAAEVVKEEVKEKTEGAIINGVKTYLNNAEEKVTTEEGKEAIDALQSIVDDAENLKKSAIGEETDDVDYLAKMQEDFVKLAEIADKHNNDQNQ